MRTKGLSNKDYSTLVSPRKVKRWEIRVKKDENMATESLDSDSGEELDIIYNMISVLPVEYD